MWLINITHPPSTHTRTIDIQNRVVPSKYIARSLHNGVHFDARKFLDILNNIAKGMHIPAATANTKPLTIDDLTGPNCHQCGRTPEKCSTKVTCNVCPSRCHIQWECLKATSWCSERCHQGNKNARGEEDDWKTRKETTMKVMNVHMMKWGNAYMHESPQSKIVAHTNVCVRSELHHHTSDIPAHMGA